MTQTCSSKSPEFFRCTPVPPLLLRHSLTSTSRGYLVACSSGRGQLLHSRSPPLPSPTHQSMAQVQRRPVGWGTSPARFSRVVAFRCCLLITLANLGGLKHAPQRIWIIVVFLFHFYASDMESPAVSPWLSGSTGVRIRSMPTTYCRIQSSTAIEFHLTWTLWCPLLSCLSHMVSTAGLSNLNEIGRKVAPGEC